MKRIITADSSANLYHDDFPDFVPVPLKIVTDSKEYVDDERRYHGGSQSRPVLVLRRKGRNIGWI